MLSLVIPGAGQMYRGKIGPGLVWLVATVIGYYLYIVPGLILHIICIVNAATGSNIATGQNGDEAVCAWCARPLVTGMQINTVYHDDLPYHPSCFEQRAAQARLRQPR